MTLLIFYILFVFAAQKFQHLVLKHNPVVNTYVERDAFDETDIWYGADHPDFMVAFSVVNFLSQEHLDDPNFVKWHADLVI